MPLLQNSGLLNNLSSKFPFEQVYAYDKEFRADLQWNPDKPWNVIDTQLWSMCYAWDPHPSSPGQPATIHLQEGQQVGQQSKNQSGH